MTEGGYNVDSGFIRQFQSWEPMRFPLARSLGLGFSKTQYRLRKQRPSFTFLQGNWSLWEISALGRGAKETFSLIPEPWQWQDWPQMPGCIRAAQVWCSPWGGRTPSCFLRGCSVEKGAHEVQEHPPSSHRAFVGAFPLLLGASTSPTATAVDQKGK